MLKRKLLLKNKYIYRLQIINEVKFLETVTAISSIIQEINFFVENTGYLSIK